MLARLLVLVVLFTSAIQPVLKAEPDNSPAAGDSQLRGAPLTEFFADGFSRGATGPERGPPDSIMPGLSISALTRSGGGSAEAAAPCEAGAGQPWLEGLLRRAMVWLSEQDCAAAESAVPLLYGDGAPSARPFHLYENEAAQAYLSSFLRINGKAFERGYRRAGRYLPMIRQVLWEEGLPEVLAYLPAVESNFNHRARSPARAIGLWQFMVATARRFGLHVRYPWYDERLDPEHATRAAARFLTYLHDRYGNWELALAAYNAGEGRVNRAIRRARAMGLKPEYWNLALPPQTRAYVPAFLAMTKLYRSPGAHGFFDMQTERPVKSETLRIDTSSSLAEVAHRLRMPLPELVRLNPAWRRGYIPVDFRDKVMLRLPVGKKAALMTSLEKEEFSSLPWLTHTVEARETLSKIARGYGVSLNDLVAVNPIPNKHFLSIGQRLIIPLLPGARKSETWLNEGKRDQSPQALLPEQSIMHMHEVREGETLYSISRRYGVSVNDLHRWNANLDQPLRPAQGMVVFLTRRQQENAVAMEVPSS